MKLLKLVPYKKTHTKYTIISIKFIRYGRKYCTLIDYFVRLQNSSLVSFSSKGPLTKGTPAPVEAYL